MMPAINGMLLAISSSLAASIVAKVTVTTALGLVAAWLARGSRAAVRHALLAAAFGVMLLLPIVSVVVPPLHIGVPVQVESRAAYCRSRWTSTLIRPLRRSARVLVPLPQRRKCRSFRCPICCSRDGSRESRFFCCRWCLVCGKFVRCADLACRGDAGSRSSKRSRSMPAFIGVSKCCCTNRCRDR